MAIASSDVVAGNSILASEYNNLRADLLNLLNGAVTLAGVKTFSAKAVMTLGITLSDDSSIASTKKFFYGGNTYDVESSANVRDCYTGGVLALRINASQNVYIQDTKRYYLSLTENVYIERSEANVMQLVTNNSVGIRIDANQNVYIQDTKRYYLSLTEDVYIERSAANVIQLVTSNSVGIRIDANQNVYIQDTKRYFLSLTENVYIERSAANVMQLVTNNLVGIQINASQQVIAPQGIAPGDNESMMWDVVIFSLDGSSSDTVAYVIDESKIYGMMATGHESATHAAGVSDTALDYYTTTYIFNNVLTIVYDDLHYVSSDAAQVIIHYVA